MVDYDKVTRLRSRYAETDARRTGGGSAGGRRRRGGRSGLVGLRATAQRADPSTACSLSAACRATIGSRSSSCSSRLAHGEPRSNRTARTTSQGSS